MKELTNKQLEKILKKRGFDSKVSWFYIQFKNKFEKEYCIEEGDHYSAFQNVINLGTKKGIEGNSIKIETPLMQLTKSDIICLGSQLGVDYALTISCYRANERGEACGECDSCFYRKKGFHEAGIADSTRYW